MICILVHLINLELFLRSLVHYFKHWRDLSSTYLLSSFSEKNSNYFSESMSDIVYIKSLLGLISIRFCSIVECLFCRFLSVTTECKRVVYSTLANLCPELWLFNLNNCNRCSKMDIHIQYIFIHISKSNFQRLTIKVKKEIIIKCFSVGFENYVIHHYFHTNHGWPML